MKIVLKKSGHRDFTLRLVQQVELVAVDCTKVEGVEGKIRNGHFVKAWEPLYVCHKENTYSDYVYRQIIRDIVGSDNKSNLDIQTISNLIEMDDDVRAVAVANKKDEDMDIDGVKSFLSNAFDAVGEFYDQLSDYFKSGSKAMHMEHFMIRILASFQSEKITKTKVVQKEEEAGDMEEEEELSQDGMIEDYDFDKES